MSTLEKNLIGAVIVLLLALGIVAVEAHKSALQNAQADGYSRGKAEEAQAAQKRMDAREAATQEQLAQLQKALEAVKTAKQAKQVIEVQVPATTGQAAVVKPEQVAPEVKAQLPEAPSYTIRTEAGEVAIAKDELQCAKDRVQLGKCSADAGDLKIQLEAAKKDAANWKQAAKGGSAGRRVLRYGILGACATGGAYAGSEIRKGKGAAIGALAAFAGCALLSR